MAYKQALVQHDSATIRTPSGRKPVQRVQQFDGIIELMLSEPTIKNKDIAAKLGRSLAWVCYMTKNDFFRAQYEQRRLERNQTLNLELNEQLTRVATKSLSAIEQKLDNNALSISTPLALEIADKTLERLGYGVALPGMQAAGVTTNVQVQLTADAFREAQAIVRRTEQKTIEMTANKPEEAHPFPLTKIGAAEPALSTLVQTVKDKINGNVDDESDE